MSPTDAACGCPTPTGPANRSGSTSSSKTCTATARSVTEKPPAPASQAGTTLTSLGARTITLRTSRSEEHTSELQSRGQLVCRLLLEKKKDNGKKSINQKG